MQFKIFIQINYVVKNILLSNCYDVLYSVLLYTMFN